MANEIPIDVVLRARDEMSAVLDKTTRETLGMSGATDKMTREVDQAGDELTDFARRASSAENATSGFGTKMIALGNIAADLAMKAFSAVASTVGDVAKAMIDGNAEFERYETQFGVLLGSSDAAKKRLQELAEFGAKTPFELPEVVRADKVLQGFGLHSEAAAEKFGLSGEQIRTLAGDLAAGTGTSFEDMAGYLGRFASGSTGEVISRFQELGITTRDELSKLGLQFEKSGELTTPTAEAFAVLAKVAKDKFGGMMDAQSKTFEGMMSNLEDWKGNTLRTIGAPIFEVLREKLGKVLEYLGSPEVQEAINGFAKNLAASIGVVVGWIDKIATMFSESGEWSSGFAESVGGIIDQLLGFEMVLQSVGDNIDDAFKLLESSNEWSSGSVETIGAFIDTVFDLGDSFQQAGIAIDDAMATIEETISAATAVIMQIWEEHGDSIMSTIKEVWSIVGDIVSTAIGIIARLIEMVFGQITSDVQGNNAKIMEYFTIAWDTIRTVVLVALDIIKGILSSALAFLNGDTQGALDKLVGMFESIWARIREVIGDEIDAAVAWVMQVMSDISNWINRTLQDIENYFTTTWRNISNTVEYWVNTIKNRASALFQEFKDDTILKFNEIKATIISTIRTAAGYWNAVAPFMGQMPIAIPEMAQRGSRGQTAGLGAMANVTINVYGGNAATAERGVVAGLQRAGFAIVR